VTPVLAQMHRDPVRPRALAQLRQQNRIGFDRAAARRRRFAVTRLTQGSAMVDVDA